MSDRRIRMSGEEKLSLKIAAAPELISQVRHSVAEHVRGLSFCEEEVDAVTLAVGEACSNAVCYGGKGQTDPQIVVTCLVHPPGQLQIDIQNSGSSFHPDIARLADLPDPAAFAVHGRGFALMRALVDDVQVLSQGNHTIVRLIKFFS